MIEVMDYLIKIKPDATIKDWIRITATNQSKATNGKSRVDGNQANANIHKWYTRYPLPKGPESRFYRVQGRR